MAWSFAVIWFLSDNRGGDYFSLWKDEKTYVKRGKDFNQEKTGGYCGTGWMVGETLVDKGFREVGDNFSAEHRRSTINHVRIKQKNGVCVIRKIRDWSGRWIRVWVWINSTSRELIDRAEPSLFIITNVLGLSAYRSMPKGRAFRRL